MSIERSEQLTASDVQHLVVEGYVPFAEVMRVIPWPGDETRMENDTEHSFSLAFVGMALGEQLGMDPYKIAAYSTIHDFPERYADDTSVWDEEKTKTKVAREEAAARQIEQTFGRTPFIAKLIHDYEHRIDEESRFVYALDKLLPLIMIMHDNGRFWKDNRITYDMHLAKVAEMRLKIGQHPAVLQWYDEMVALADMQKDQLFFTPQQLG